MIINPFQPSATKFRYLYVIWTELGIKHLLSDLTARFEEKFYELSKSIKKTLGEQKESAEDKIKEDPLAYMAGAFVGGVIVGYVIGKGRR